MYDWFRGLERELMAFELAKPDDLSPELHPQLDYLSAGFMHRLMYWPLAPQAPAPLWPQRHSRQRLI